VGWCRRAAPYPSKPSAASTGKLKKLAVSEDGEQALQHLLEPRAMAGERLTDALEGIC
jgi:hypothetical protein